MRKTLLLSFLFALCAAMQAQNAPAQAVVGDYSGELYVSLFEEVYDENTIILDEDTGEPIPYTVNITAEADGTIVFSLNNFSFLGLPLGDIRLPGIAVNGEGQRYTFGDNEPQRFDFLEGEIIADASLDNARSYVESDSLVAYIPVEWIMEDDERTPIYVLFKGKRLIPESIASAQAAHSAAEIYDLAGRRRVAVMQLPKGLYIVGGKKQIVK